MSSFSSLPICGGEEPALSAQASGVAEEQAPNAQASGVAEEAAPNAQASGVSDGKSQSEALLSPPPPPPPPPPLKPEKSSTLGADSLQNSMQTPLQNSLDASANISEKHPFPPPPPPLKPEKSSTSGADSLQTSSQNSLDASANISRQHYFGIDFEEYYRKREVPYNKGSSWKKDSWQEGSNSNWLKHKGEADEAEEKWFKGTPWKPTNKERSKTRGSDASSWRANEWSTES